MLTPDACAALRDAGAKLKAAGQLAIRLAGTPHLSAEGQRTIVEGIYRGIDAFTAVIPRQLDSWPFCDACQSWHHPNNPTCRKRVAPGAI